MASQGIQFRKALIALSTAASAGNTDVIAELRNGRLRLMQAKIEVTSRISSGWEDSLRGTRSFTGTAESIHIPSSAQTARVAADAIINDYALSVLFQPSTVASATYCYTGTIQIDDYELGGDVNGAMAQNVSFHGIGALTYSTST